jgi:hypothetical protein
LVVIAADAGHHYLRKKRPASGATEFRTILAGQLIPEKIRYEQERDGY